MSSLLARSLLSRMVKNHQGLGERSLNAGWSRCLKECTSLLYTEVERLTLALRTTFEVAVGMERTKVFFPLHSLTDPLEKFCALGFESVANRWS